MCAYDNGLQKNEMKASHGTLQIQSAIYSPFKRSLNKVSAPTFRFQNIHVILNSNELQNIRLSCVRGDHFFRVSLNCVIYQYFPKRLRIMCTSCAALHTQIHHSVLGAETPSFPRRAVKRRSGRTVSGSGRTLRSRRRYLYEGEHAGSADSPEYEH